MRSYVPDYDLVPAGTLSNALEMLASGEGWRPIAGGTDLMVLFNGGTLPFRKLVGIRDIGELRAIEITDSSVVLGSAVTYTQIRQSALFQNEFRLLCMAASWTGAIANQNRGTLGGNIVNASPAADSPPALLVYDAELQLISKRGMRWIPYGEFHTGYKQMQMNADELLYQIRLPRVKAQWRQYTRKVGPRRAQAISKVCMAAAARVTEGVIEDVRIALGSVAPVPLRCVQTEALLSGNELNATMISQGRDVIRGEIQPISDIRSTQEYRTQVSANLLQEFLETLL